MSIPLTYFPTLKRLGSGCFRVVWFGNVVTGESVDHIMIVFSPLKVDPETGEEVCDCSERHSVSLPVAYLRKFRIGDIWKSGSPTGRKNLSDTEVFDLVIDESTVSVLPVGVPVHPDQEHDDYVLPFTEFVGHRDHTHAQCARLALTDGALLVIPCMELVRFYFGMSGSFLKRIFSGAFALEKLYTHAEISPTTRIANIALAPDLSGIAASTIARIAFDHRARSAARWIVNSNVATAANRQAYYPKTTFPFLGNTQLTAHGRWICSGKQKIFLAEQLASCTHPFPFEELFYTTTRSVAKLSCDSISGGDPPPQEPSSTSNPGNSDAVELSNDPISHILQYIGLPVDDDGTVSFPDLEKKKVRRIKSGKHRFGEISQESLAKLFGAGGETSNSTVRGAEFGAVEDDDIPEGEDVPDAVQLFEKAVLHGEASWPGEMHWKLLGKLDSENLLDSVPLGTIPTDIDNSVPTWAGLLNVSNGGIRSSALVLIRPGEDVFPDGLTTLLLKERNAVQN